MRVTAVTPVLNVSDIGASLVDRGFGVSRRPFIGAKELPKDRQSAGNAACAARGDAWLAAPGHAAVCRVPSAVTPETECLLLDPAHRDSKRVKVRGVREWRFDGRLFQAARGDPGENPPEAT